jgi:NAD(P)-dependent dehydrogenase (short-subunit alcohol dehydrogenase family)
MKTNLFDLEGKIALVTGASRGIGESIAKLLAQQGAHVIVSSRKIDDCKRVADDIIAAGDSAEAIACHIGEIAQIEACMNVVQQKHGRLDILVNNAATNPYFGHILDTDIGSLSKTVDVNIRGYFLMSQAGAKLMASHGGGSIINTASVNGIQPGFMQGIYSITKAAVISMTQAFALECADRGIRCNAIAPGLTKTKFAGALFNHESTYKAALAKIPMHRHAEPDEMAGAVLFLASAASSYVNGETIVIDGGMTISNL